MDACAPGLRVCLLKSLGGSGYGESRIERTVVPAFSLLLSAAAVLLTFRVNLSICWEEDCWLGSSLSLLARTGCGDARC